MMPFSFPDWLLQRSEKNFQLLQESFNYFDSQATNSGHTNLYQQTDSCILYWEICTDMSQISWEKVILLMLLPAQDRNEVTGQAGLVTKAPSWGKNLGPCSCTGRKQFTHEWDLCELGRMRVATGLSFVAGAVAYFVLRAGKQKVKNFRRYNLHCGSKKKFKEFLMSWVVLTGIEK